MKMNRHMGDIWMSLSIEKNGKFRLTDVYLGSLADNWELIDDSGNISSELSEIDVFPNIKEGKYSINIERKYPLPNVLETAISGMNLQEYFATVKKKCFVEESMILEMVNNRINLSDILTPDDELYNVISAIRLNDKVYWNIAETPSANEKTFKICDIDGIPVLVFPHDKECNFIANEEFIIILQYGTHLLDIKIVSDDIFMKTVNFKLSWTIKNNNKIGYLISEFNSCSLEGEFNNDSDKIKYNFDGKPIVSFSWLT